MVAAEDRMERALAAETQAQRRQASWASSLLGGNHRGRKQVIMCW